ncbi:hypothetical protein Plec18167_007165 [Paecilomyces lecythidis]|uniref:FAD/NAD(P)-binding domain-containing protein n=1 Tax=Paecilomyces lecythidis TaxID=3004212 RepID=A0ABR3X5L8_9EURO
MQNSKASFDALVIGGGPAGLSAAMALGRACRTVALFDSQEYRNEGVTMMHNVICHDGENPDNYRDTAAKEILDKYDTITLIKTKIIGAKHITAGARPRFEVTNNEGVIWSGRKLILASGTREIFPNIKGYKELWGNGIVHCLFCDGYEKRGGHVGILGLQSMKELTFTLMSFLLAREGVTVFTNGVSSVTDNDAQKARQIAEARGARFDHRVIESLSENPDGEGVRIQFREGGYQNVRMLLSTPTAINRAADLISSLGLETETGPNGYVICKSPMHETSLHGCFVAGDTSTPAKIVSVAQATGSLAGIGAAMQLAMDDASGSE